MCTWNNRDRLSITLDAFSQCDAPPVPWELVLVGNNCTDDTDRVARDFEAVLPIRYVPEPRQGLSRARNTGIANARGDLIVFTDDDVKPARGWLATYWDAFLRHPTDVFFGGSVLSEFEGPEPDAAVLRFVPWSVKGLHLGTEERPLRPGESFLSANWALPKEGLTTSGGFDEGRGLGAEKGRLSVGEELELQDRLRARGWTGLVLPNATIEHFVPASKTRLQHIADRCEANGYQEGLKAVAAAEENVVATLFGLPRWRVREALEHWIAYRWLRLLRRDHARHYLPFRINLGALRAHRDANGKEAP